MARGNRFGTVPAAMVVASAAILAFASQPCSAQDQVITVHSGGLDGCLVSPKDAGLKTVLRMIDERIMELPAEIGDPSMPAPVIRMALDLLMRPMSIRVSTLPGFAELEFENLDAPPFTAQFDFYTASPDEAVELAGRFGELIAMAAPVAPQPDAEHSGLQIVDADGVPLRFGAGRIGGQNAVSIALNGYDTNIQRLDLSGLPAGVQPAIAMEADLSPLMPLIEKAIESAPQADRAMFEAQLQMYGIDGNTPLRMIGAAGYGSDRAHSFFRMIGGKSYAEGQNALATTSITEADMRLVPADATYAEVRKFNPVYLTSMLDMMSTQMPPQMQGEDPIAMIEQSIGIDLQGDLIDHLGETYWSYTAPSTGGGLFGYVTILELSNAAGMRDTLSNLTQMANQMAQGPARGYVRFMSRQVGEHEMTVLTFPGLPIPLEISFAIVGDRLFSALSPQSLSGAINHAANPASSVLDNPRFSEMGGGVSEGAMQIAFVDTPELAPAGYGLVSMGMSALSNAVRSPTDPEREPGLVMPSMTDLLSGAKASVYITTLEGEDIVMRAQGDRSALVNACGIAGAMGGATGAAVVGALAAGVVMPATASARSQAMHVQSMAQLRQVAMAVHVYAAENDDMMPESIGQLIELGYLSQDSVDSPIGDMGDGIDFGLRTTGRMSATRFPDQQILAWDRTMVRLGDRVNVAFVDGHVQSLMWPEWQRILAHPSNEGVDMMKQ